MTDTLPHTFCSQLNSLLQTLSDTFREKETVARWRDTFQTMYLGTADMEDTVTRQWYDGLYHDATGARRSPDLVTLLQAGRMDELFGSDLWVFQAIQASELYFDELLSDDDRAAIVAHLSVLNDLAISHCTGSEGAVIADDPTESIQQLFCRFLDALLSMLATKFPAREQLTRWRDTFRGMYKDNKDMQDTITRQWYDGLYYDASGTRRAVDLVKLLQERRMDELFAADLWVFSSIGAASLYSAPELTDTDREQIIDVLNRLNNFATVNAISPPGLSDMVMTEMQSGGGGAGVNMESIQRLMQGFISKPDSAEKLIAWATTMNAEMARPDSTLPTAMSHVLATVTNHDPETKAMLAQTSSTLMSLFGSSGLLNGGGGDT
jgi:hypothetical protein